MTYVLLSIIGLIIGSFLNAVIYRIPLNLSLWSPGSRCPKCETPIRWLYNIPLWGYLIQLGRCARCKEKISFTYPLVEILSAGILCLMYYQFGFSLIFLKLSYLGLLMLALSFVDYKFHIIPNRILLFSFPLAVIFSALPGKDSFIDGLLGSLAGGAGLWAMWFLGRLMYKKDALGGGDIKLAALLGLFLGWKILFLSFFLSFILITAVGWTGILFRKLNRGSEMPVAPFLTPAVLISVLYGHVIIHWYLQFFSN